MAEGPILDRARAADISVFTLDTPESILRTGRNIFSFSAGPIAPLQKALSALPAVRDVSKLLKTLKTDIVYTNSAKAHVIGGIAGKTAGKKVIWHFRDYPAETAVRTFFSVLSHPVADVVVCNSKFTSSQFEGRRALKVVPNGIPVEAVKPTKAPAAVKAGFGFEPDCLVAGTAGRLEQWKGIHTFIEAAAALSSKFPTARYVVAGAPFYGDAGYPNRLRNMAREAGVANRVVFTGHRNDIHDVMNAYDVYVHPSVQPEPFGRGIVEAMLLKKPVAASRAGGPLEIVEENKTGKFFAPGNPRELAEAVSGYFGDASEAKAAGEAGFERASVLFSADRVAREISEIILDCFKS